MRPGQQNKRGRGRNNNGGGGSNNSSNNNNNNNNSNFNRKGSNPLTRTYDSSGPDVKVRGTAQHIAEKYTTLARDSHSSGDRVMAENYLQHAEHYNRIIASAQAQLQERFQRDERSEFSDGNDGDDIDSNDSDMGFASPLQPREQPQQREQREQPQQREQQSREQRDQQPREQRDQQPREQREPRQQREPREQRDNQPREQREPRKPREQRDQQPRENREQPAASEQPILADQAEQPVIVDQAPVREAREPRAPRTPRQPRTPAAVIDADGPQPIIEGTPAEVAVEAESSAAEAIERAPRRRAAVPRPRRTPRAGSEGEASAEAPDLAPVEPE